MKKIFSYVFLLLTAVMPLQAQVPGLRPGASTAKSGADNYPDNVAQEPCSFPVESSDWSIRIDDILGAGPSGDSICTLINPLVGDLDGDGIPEIVCFSTRNADNTAFTGSGNPGSKVKNVVVYDGVSHLRKAKFDLPSYVSAFEATPFGLAKPYGGDALMVFACTDCNLYAYKLDGNGGATRVWGPVSYGSGNDYATTVGFADFNNDSIPEVYVRNKIFNLATGQLLLTVNSSNSGSTYAHVGASGASGRKPLSASFASDVVGDARCELLLGNEIHSINITNTGGTTGNSSTLYATAPSTGVSGIGSDGHVQVADFNLDGHPDLFISSRPAQGNSGTVYGYVWDVHNNTVSTPIAQAVSLPGKSIPLIADIDNDNVPEVVLHCGVSGANIRAYKYDAATRTFSLFWTKGFSEDSYSNSMTLFDFNQDGENELLICDNDMISIVNGSTPALAATAIYTYPFREVTIMQYPVIADIDNDGAAEIVFVGKQNSQSYQGTLNICRSNGDPWAPARPVWNQYMYNITNVNHDLTIPAVLFNNAHQFVDNSGSVPVIRRPYNNFLQQATNIDTSGKPYRTAADLVIGDDAAVTPGSQEVHFVFDVCNQGEASFDGDTLFISLYKDSYGGTYIESIENVSFLLPPDSCLHLDFYLPTSLFCDFTPMHALAVAVNDRRGEGVGHGGVPMECDTTNNLTVLPFAISQTRDTIFDTVCQNMAYTEHGFNIDSRRTAVAGWLTDSLSSPSACGAVTILRLWVMASESVDTVATACDSFTWYGRTYTQSGDFSRTVTPGGGCEQLVTLHLTVNSSYNLDEDVDLCMGDVVEINGRRISEPGDYSNVYTSVAQCDSVVVSHVVLRPVYNRVDSVSMCSSDPEVGYRWVDGETYYYSTDTPRYRLVSRYGCDSLLQLYLTVDRSLRAVIHCEPEFPTYENARVCVSDATTAAQSRRWYLFDGTVSEEPACCFDMPYDADSVVIRLIVASSAGCYDTANLVIPMDRSAVYIPNAFTPNLGTNRIFRVYGRSLIDVQTTIYNREGLLVSSFEGLTEGWDGTHDGERCPQGTYVYRVRYRTAGRPGEWQVVAGTVTLLR